MASLPSRPVFARQSETRKFGRTFERLDEHSAESLCYRELGKVNVDCKFRSSDSLWGVLGESKRPAGILYMDLVFHQPKEYRLSSATVLVTLQDGESPPLEPERSRSRNRVVHYYVVTPGSLHMDKFGPKKITGEQKTKTVTSKTNLTPNLTVMGNGGGGVGKDTEETRTYGSRWIFEGNLIPGERTPNGPRSSKYRTLRWDLSENDMDLGVEHSNEFHIGFSFEHQQKPCYLKVEISGKLQSKRHRLKHRLKFPPSSRKDQGSALTWIGLDKTHQFRTRLDSISDGLSRDLEWKNYSEIPAQLPDALPATFQEAPAVEQPAPSPQTPAITRLESVSSVDISEAPYANAIAPDPPVGLLEQNASSLDPMTMYLARGSDIFGGPAGVRQKIQQEPVFRRQNPSDAFDSSTVDRRSMNQPESPDQPKSSPISQSRTVEEERARIAKVVGEVGRVSGGSEDADRGQRALIPILMLMQFLNTLRDYFGQNLLLVVGGRGRKIKFASSEDD